MKSARKEIIRFAAVANPQVFWRDEEHSAIVHWCGHLLSADFLNIAHDKEGTMCLVEAFCPHCTVPVAITREMAEKMEVKTSKHIRLVHARGNWEQKRQLAEETLAISNGNGRLAAVALRVSYSTFRLWLRGSNKHHQPKKEAVG